MDQIFVAFSEYPKISLDKAELLQLNRTDFLPWEFLLQKKLEIEKNKIRWP